MFSLSHELDARGKRNCEARHGKRGPQCEKYQENFQDNLDILKKDLKLNEQQIDKINTINRSFQKKFLDVKQKLEPKIIQLKKLLLEDNVDINSLRNIFTEMASLRVKIHMIRILRHIEIEKVLDSRQKRKFQENRMRLRHKKCPGCSCPNCIF